MLIGLTAGTLAACGGRASAPASSSPAAAAPKSPSAAPPSAAPAVPSASVIGQRAPGPYRGAAAATVSGGQASMSATDALKWQPDTLVVKGGGQVTLQIKNTGNTVHTFIAPALGVNTAQNIDLQKTATVTFTAPSAPGAYQFWCNVPGHAEAGMVGEVIVQ